MKLKPAIKNFLKDMVEDVKKYLIDNDIRGAFDKLSENDLYKDNMNVFMQLLVDSGVNVFDAGQSIPYIEDDFNDVDFHDKPIICGMDYLYHNLLTAAYGIKKIVIKKSVNIIDPRFFNIDFYDNPDVEIFYEGSEEEFFDKWSDVSSSTTDVIVAYRELLKTYDVKIYYGE